jgi:hypothetical protein
VTGVHEHGKEGTYLQTIRIGDGRLWLDVRLDDPDGPSGNMRGKTVRFFRDWSIVGPEPRKTGDA